jgi:hypothetical protein
VKRKRRKGKRSRDKRVGCSIVSLFIAWVDSCFVGVAVEVCLVALCSLMYCGHEQCFRSASEVIAGVWVWRGVVGVLVL